MKNKGIKLNKIFVFMVVVSLVFQLVTPVEVHATMDELQDAYIEYDTNYTITTDSSTEENSDDLDNIQGTSDETDDTNETDESEVSNDNDTEENIDTTNESKDELDKSDSNANEEIENTNENDECSGDTEDTNKNDEYSEETEDALDDNTVSGNDIQVIPEEEIIDNMEQQSTYPDNIQTLVDILGKDNVEVDIDTNTIKLLQDINITSSLVVTGLVKLDLNGNTLSGTIDNSAISLISVQGTLEISGGSIEFSGGDNAISIASTGKLVNNDCNITTTNCNRAVFSSGIFDMHGGTISNNTSSANGAGIVVHGTNGIFNMYGGTISNNTANIGGGLRVQTGATANITGNSIIENNIGRTSAGGIHVLNATCNISGNATVKNNNSIKGGGIYLEGNSTMTLSGDCRVEGNSTKQIEKDLSATLNITDNAYVESDEAPPVGQTLQDLIDNTPVGSTLTLDKDYMNQSSVIINKDITIDFNEYTVEGAIASEGQLFSIQNCKAKFINGKISQRSGAGTYYITVNIQSNSNVDFEKLEIATPRSQSILVENSELNLSECNIHDCGNDGGNIRLITGTLNMNSGSISNCRSLMGGAIRAVKGSTLNIQGGTIENNSADGKASDSVGGALYSIDSTIMIGGGN